MTARCVQALWWGHLPWTVARSLRGTRLQGSFEAGIPRRARGPPSPCLPLHPCQKHRRGTAGAAAATRQRAKTGQAGSSRPALLESRGEAVPTHGRLVYTVTFKLKVYFPANVDELLVLK